MGEYLHRVAGHYVSRQDATLVVAHTDTEEQTTLVQRIIGESTGAPAALLRESPAVPTAPA